jgi:RHS repeat-associated protein
LQSDGKEYHYVGDILYVKLNASDALKTYQIGHDEGRIVSDGTDLVYEYAYHDHQGNLRVSFIDSAGVAVISQQNDYDPWGLPLVGLDRASRFANANFYGFNGQEQLEAGYQNMGWRWYDKTNGRMTGIDPMNQFASGYVGLGNNPVSLTDPDGRFVPLVIAGAALVGGAINLYSNWGKIKDGDWKAGAAYFVSGAAGGVTSLYSAAGGGAVTATLNVGIDIATGNTPELKRPSDYVGYAAQEIAIGTASSVIGAEVGKLVGPSLQSVFKWTQTGFANATKQTITIGGQAYTYFFDAGVKLTKSLFQSIGGMFGRTTGGTLSNMEVRLWYNNQLKSLNTAVAFTEKNALRLNTQRNNLKIQARNMMADRESAALLNQTDPIKPFKFYVQKYSEQGYSGENLWQRIIQGSSTPNLGVNAKFGIK